MITIQKFSRYCIIIVAILLISCTDENKLLKEVKKCGSNCVINISNIYNFQWDSVYLFDESFYYFDVEKIIKTKPGAYSKFKEFQKKMIFLDKGRVIKVVSFDTGIGSRLKDEIVFDIGNKRYSHLKKEDSRFRVVKSKKNRFFVLKSIGKI